MAIGTGAAILGSAVIGGGAAIASNRAQSSAIRNAQASQDRAADQSIALQRQIFQQQRADFEPFRQYGIQQANAMGEVLGFNPVRDFSASGAVPGAVNMGGTGQRSVYDAYFADNPDLQQEYARFGGRPGGYGFGPNLPASYDDNGNGRVDPEEYGRFHYERFGRAEGRGLPTQTPPMVAQPTTAEPATMQSQQDAARARFEGSLFNDALQGALGRAATAVDSNFAASGNVYSGAREQAQANTAADLGMNALAQYTNFMMGSPNSSGAAGAASAAGQYGANVGNILAQQGANAAQSAYAQGQNTSNLIGDLSGLASFGLGAFGGAGGMAMPKMFGGRFGQQTVVNGFKG